MTEPTQTKAADKKAPMDPSMRAIRLAAIGAKSAAKLNAMMAEASKELAEKVAKMQEEAQKELDAAIAEMDGVKAPSKAA